MSVTKESKRMLSMAVAAQCMHALQTPMYGTPLQQRIGTADPDHEDGDCSSTQYARCKVSNAKSQCNTTVKKGKWPVFVAIIFTK